MPALIKLNPEVARAHILSFNKAIEENSKIACPESIDLAVWEASQQGMIRVRDELVKDLEAFETTAK
jgi:hypothetical protein